MSGDRKGVIVLTNPASRFPEATAFGRNPDGSLSVFEDGTEIASFEPGYNGAFMSAAAPDWQ